MLLPERYSALPFSQIIVGISIDRDVYLNGGQGQVQGPIRHLDCQSDLVFKALHRVRLLYMEDSGYLVIGMLQVELIS